MITAVAGLTAEIWAHGWDTDLDELINGADAVVAVEILSVDYTATAADGPMYANARVLKVLKGNVPKSWRLRFGESAWWSPTYKKGERRIVFLDRNGSGEGYYKTKWHTVYTGQVGFFFAEDSLDGMNQTSLLSFLREVQKISLTPPKIEFSMIYKSATKRALSVTVINDRNQSLWLNPSRMSIWFEANQVRYCRQIDWVRYHRNTWMEMEPTRRIRGSLSIEKEEIERADEIQVVLSHLSVLFPYPGWIGFRSANVSLRN